TCALPTLPRRYSSARNRRRAIRNSPLAFTSPGTAGGSESQRGVSDGPTPVSGAGEAARHRCSGKRSRLSRPASAGGQAGSRFDPHGAIPPGGYGSAAGRGRGPDDPHRIRIVPAALVSGQGAGGGPDHPLETGFGPVEIRAARGKPDPGRHPYALSADL